MGFFNSNILRTKSEDLTPVTNYSGISRIYFNRIILKTFEIIKKHSPKTVLDFGCGKKKLSFLLKKETNITCLNYDIKKELSEIDSYKDYQFDFFVANHVLAFLNEDELVKLLTELKVKNKDLLFIFGIGTQSILAKMLAFLTLNFKSHAKTKLSFNQQLKVIKEFCEIRNVQDIFFITKILYCKFKD